MHLHAGLPAPSGRHGLTPLAAALVLLAVLAALAGDPATRLLRYERDAVLAGEAWRLLTGHLVHLGGMHLALNAAALALVVVLLGGLYGPARWAAVALVSSLGVSVGLLLASPQVAWYVGLSGTIHGIAAAGGASLAIARRGAGAVLLLVLAAKLAWEQSTGASAGVDRLIGGAVVVDAHLYGALAGGAVSLLFAMAAARRARA